MDTRVFVRIRPLAKSGGHATADEEQKGVAKALEGWSDHSVTLSTQYLFSKQNNEYTFPTNVFAPEATQRQVYETVAAPLVDEFTTGRRNVMMFAYGQTGSGKTHTMLGTDDSLTNSNPSSPNNNSDDGWGIFPRIYEATRDAMKQQQQSNCILLASAIEFYLGECSDLLQPADGKNKPVQIDIDSHEPMGASVREMKDTSDLLQLIQSVQKNRKTRGTRMNEANDLHGGSSRSHAAIILTLLQQLDHPEERNTYCRTSFTIVDLAGAERPTKTGEQRFGGGDYLVWMMQQQGKKAEIPTGAQAFIINWELSNIMTEVEKATTAHKKKQKYAPPRQLVTEIIKFLGASLDGSAVTSMCLCLSPANVNGWETWFSLQYGTAVSKLKIPIKRQKCFDIDSSLKLATRDANLAAEEFATAPRNKFYETRRMRAEFTRQRKEQLEQILTCLKENNKITKLPN